MVRLPLPMPQVERLHGVEADIGQLQAVLEVVCAELETGHRTANVPPPPYTHMRMHTHTHACMHTHAPMYPLAYT